MNTSGMDVKGLGKVRNRVEMQSLWRLLMV